MLDTMLYNCIVNYRDKYPSTPHTINGLNVMIPMISEKSSTFIKIL